MSVEQLSNPQLLVTQQTTQGDIKVFENSLFRWLCFDDEQAIQSCMSRQEPTKLILPYQQFMMMWSLLRVDSPPTQACLLGLGGGDMVRYLRKHFPSMNVLAVDSDPVIAKLATKYFSLTPDQKKLIIEIANAENIIQKLHNQDLLLIDIVVRNQLPEFLLKTSFWQDCYSSLNENGIMVVNVIPDSESEFLNLLKTLREIFGHIPLCMGVPDHKNIVLLMPLLETSMPSLSQLKQRITKLQTQADLPYEQCIEILTRDNVQTFALEKSDNV